MAASDIVIRGAREHNLRDLDIVLPRNRLICLTGVSGSGKSSLAFDTLYAEGQRRYVESLSSFARQFLGQMPKPDVDQISGLSPSISIAQKSSGQNPRSTVGTITEIYDFLRVLYARCGLGHCPNCGRAITAQSREQILARILELPKGCRYQVLAPLVRQQKGQFRDLFDDLLKQGFVRARVDGQWVRLENDLRLDRRMRHDIDLVVDRLTADADVRPRLAEAVDIALKLGDGNLIVAVEADEVAGKSSRTPAADLQLSARYACTPCGLSFEPPTPQLFSFNSPQGMCPSCNGLGYLHTFDPKKLIPNPSRSFQQGAIEPLGRWRDLGRWRRHIFKGVAETLERLHGLEPGTVLETAWEELAPELQHALLWGTGDLHITYTWRAGRNSRKHGGQFEGVIPALMSKYRQSRNRMHRRMLEKYMSVLDCSDCGGERLNPQARAVTIRTCHESFRGREALRLPQICALSIREAADFFSQLDLDATGQRIAAELLKEIRARLGFLLNVGLDYLTLDRRAPTLSGGESQRIRLASQIGSGLVGVLYILDEPSIGLHPRDNDRLLKTLIDLRDMGNTVVVVEHDEDTMRTADCLIDFGPGPGVRGGELVAHGTLDEVCRAKRSVTGAYLSGKRQIPIPQQRRSPGESWLRVVGARHNNLKAIDVEIPLGLLVCVTGVSGSGKSSLVNDILVEALRRDLNGGEGRPGQHERIEGLEALDKMIAIDQSPIGRTPRSNPGTYIKVFDDIRRLYAQLPEAKARGYAPGRFSFNVNGGRCQACEGNGSHRLEMDFLADVWVTCPVCEGHRFNRETLQIRFKGKSIADVLEMDVQEALEHFENITPIRHKLQTLHDVGLDYLKLGQPSPTLSGGEAQRIKLARELVKKSTGRTLYLLDEPTTGLHFADIEMLLRVLQSFVDAGNTVLVVEHNLDVIKTADYVIDLGPEGGEAGGRIVATGTPEEVAQTKNSYTGRALADVLPTVGRGRRRTANKSKQIKPKRPRKSTLVRAVKVQGARQHNLKSIDVEIPREQITVCCGLSGSGKSSLAMDTVYAEGQRRYVESLSAYARQFVNQMQKPELDHISGLSPAIALEQKNLGNTPRSTVGTVTEVYDYFRILFARLGEPYCPDCEQPIGTQTSDQIVDHLLSHAEGTRLYLMAPLEVHVGEHYETLWEELRSSGYRRVRIDGQTHSLDNVPTIDRRRRHRVEAVVDRVIVRRNQRARLADSVEKALDLGRGVMHVAHVREEEPETRWQVDIHSQHLACRHCGRSFDQLTPHHFSFNSPLGWCESCEGLGTEYGVSAAALLNDPELTLAEGAVAIWPQFDQPLARALLEGLAAHTGLPLDVPYSQLAARHRRIVLHGTGEEWITARLPAKGAAKNGSRDKGGATLRFQYKGLFPALKEASRLSYQLRGELLDFADEVDCSECGGTRLRDDASAVRVRNRTIDELCRMPLARLLDEVRSWKLSKTEQNIVGEVVREIENRLRFLVDVGLDYLTLGRPAPTLSGGEAQRIRLAAQVGSGLTGVLYVLDEPTIGLHPRDNQRLIDALKRLRDLGNTLLLVEHDREVLGQADHLLDFGPAAGHQGGRIVAQGTPERVARRRASVTGPYLSGRKAIAVPTNRRMPSILSDTTSTQDSTGSSSHSAERRPATAARRTGTAPSTSTKRRRAKSASKVASTKALPTPPGGGWLEIVGARENNLKNINVRIPLGTLTAVTGVSGSGKSSLIDDVLYQALARRLHRASVTPGAHDKIRGIKHINKVIRVDQQPLGNTPSSNPATYTGVFDHIRSLYAQLPESKLRGYSARQFSFNVPGGRCETCEGNGQICVEMHFLPDVWIRCETCGGRRYNPETLAVTYRGHSIADVLNMPCGRAVELFDNIPKIRRTLQMLCDVGLDYVRLGQPAPTLSGGEAQRVKLAAELARPQTGRTLYLLDEPTTGLHFDDLKRLLDVLNRLVDLGNTVVVIEHNLDLIKAADFIIDLGPEAGLAGGEVVAWGTPEDVVQQARQYHDASTRRNGASRGSQSRKTKAAASNKKKQQPTDAFGTRRSYTGELLGDVLAAGPHRKRPVHDFAAEAARKEGDINIADVGKGVKAPWQVDGRRWHTRDRVSRTGEPCHWDGRILSKVVDRIQATGQFAETNWSKRTVVEITSPHAAHTGWFFHAMTGDPWLLGLKFRVQCKDFQREKLARQLDLKPLNEMPELPIYGSEPRVRFRQLSGPWKEIHLLVHHWKEVDRPAFWNFLSEAVRSYAHGTNTDASVGANFMSVFCHLISRGRKLGTERVAWNDKAMLKLWALLADIFHESTADCSQPNEVRLRYAHDDDPLVTLRTRHPEAIDLMLRMPKGHVGPDDVADFGIEQRIDTAHDRYDLLHLRFRNTRDLQPNKLSHLLRKQRRAMVD